MKTKKQPALSQAGGLVVLVCFFLPWITRDGEEMTGSKVGGITWLVLLAGLLVVGSVHYFRSIGRLSGSKVIIRSAVILSLILLVFKWLDLSSARIGIFPIGMLTSYEIAYGGVGTLLGLLLAFYGTFFLDDELGSR